METLLATLLAKLLGIAGLGGFVSGLCIRSLTLALCGGATAGVLGQIVLVSLRSTSVGVVSWVAAIIAGLLAALIGWAVRGRRLSNR